MHLFFDKIIGIPFWVKCTTLLNNYLSTHLPASHLIMLGVGPRRSSYVLIWGSRHSLFMICVLSPNPLADLILTCPLIGTARPKSFIMVF